jgi:integrase
MPKRVAPINAKTLERLKPSGQTVEVIDGAVPGLRARLSRAGTLSWSLNVRVKGVRRRIMVGEGLGLARARRKAEEMRRQIGDGVDPTAMKKEQLQRQKDAEAGVGTLTSLLDAYFQHRNELRTGAKQQELLRAVFKAHLDRPALDLTPPMAQLAVDAWAQTRSKTSAARAVTYAKPFFRWTGRRSLTQRGFGELEHPPQGQKRQLALRLEQVAKLLMSLGNASRDNAIRTMLATGARCGEVCGMTWGELALDEGKWTIPGRRRKNVKPGRPMDNHAAWLSRWLLRTLRKIGPDKPDALVFPGPRGLLGGWPAWTRRTEARLGFAVTPHALRRSFATMLGEVGAPPHLVEAALGHALGDAVARAYNKATYIGEVREYIERLGERLDWLEAAGENVVTLPRRA